MKRSWLILLILALIVFVLTLLALELFSKEPLKMQVVGNGTILETVDGFPYATYEEWLEQGRKQMTFDEARIKSEFSLEKFKEEKEKRR